MGNLCGAAPRSKFNEKNLAVLSVYSPNSLEQQQQQQWPLDHEWVITIQKKLEVAHQEEVADSWSKFCIYKIPNSLREGNDKAYVPQSVSLGPYHYGKKRLKDMDRHKWRSLYQVLKRSNHDIKMYLNAMKELEEKVRACYEGPITLSTDEFVEMLVLDGCFMLELFRGAAHRDGFEQLGYRRNDPVFAMRVFMHSIKRDMIMLENQLPLFVLERLLDLQMNVPEGYVSDLISTFFESLIPAEEPLPEPALGIGELCNRLWPKRLLKNFLIKSPPNYDVASESRPQTTMSNFDPSAKQGSLHCLDLYRGNLLRGIQRCPHTARNADKERQQLIHCVTELRESGIKFKKRETDRFWDIKFEDGILWIPRLQIHDGTKSLFLNLIAFEQCHLDCRNDITSYAIFMDNLINSPEDVGYLRYSGIIEHWLGNDAEVSNLFNQLCQEVVVDFDDSYLSQLSIQVNRYYKDRWNKERAYFKRNYFKNIWTIISVVAAVFLLLLTFLQTFYSMYGYYHPIG